MDVEEAEDAVRGASVVVLCTHATEPVIDPRWIEPGTHVSSVGSQAELPTGLLGRGPLVVETREIVGVEPPAGPAELATVDPSATIELGELIQDPSLGRRDGTEVTVYKSTGHAVQDIAAATIVYRAAVAAGAGTVVGL